MFCTKCGKKNDKATKFCSNCGSRLSKTEDKVAISKPQFKKYLLIFIATVSIGLLLFFGFRLTKILWQKIFSPTTIHGIDLKILDNIETSHYQENKERASQWDQAAKICEFYVSLESLDDKSPFITYDFCSPSRDQEKMMFEASGNLGDYFKYRETSYLLYGNLGAFSNFPPPISALKAMQLTLNAYYKQANPDYQLNSYSLWLSGTDEGWIVNLIFKDKNSREAKSSCTVSLKDKQARCQEPELTSDRAPTTVTKDNDFSDIKDCETSFLKEAQEKAQSWSNDAQLIRFYFNSRNLTKSYPPTISYTFYSPSKDLAYETIRNPNTKNIITKEEPLYSIIKKDTPFNFPPSLTAYGALNKAIAELETDYPHEKIVKVSGSCTLGDDYWFLILNPESDPSSVNNTFKVYFNGQIEKVKR